MIKSYKMVRASNFGEGNIFRTRPDRPRGPPDLSYEGHPAPSSGVKLPGRGIDLPLPSTAEVKEGIELYVYSPSGLHGLF